MKVQSRSSKIVQLVRFQKQSTVYFVMVNKLTFFWLGLKAEILRLTQMWQFFSFNQKVGNWPWAMNSFCKFQRLANSVFQVDYFQMKRLHTSEQPCERLCYNSAAKISKLIILSQLKVNSSQLNNENRYISYLYFEDLRHQNFK